MWPGAVNQVLRRRYRHPATDMCCQPTTYANNLFAVLSHSLHHWCHDQSSDLPGDS